MAKLIALVVLALTFQVNAETLCGISDVKESNVKEEVLEFESALRSVNNLESLERPNSLNSFELQLARHNHLQIIKGALLKQNVLFLRRQFEISGADSDKANYEMALGEFCEFLKNAKYMD